MKNINKQELYKLLLQRHEQSKYTSLKQLPLPTMFKDMQKASKRIVQAIQKKEAITVVGDYDVDGVCSSAIMQDFFRQIDYEVAIIIPNRFEHGYGLSPKIIEKIDSGLIITVDNGISAHEAAKDAHNKNLELIITDHHIVPDELPKAYAIVNPKQDDCPFPFKEICGAQVAWYLCAAIKKELDLAVDMGSFLDILSLAIIADIMPMKSLNYTMVKYGLQMISCSKRPSFMLLNQLMQKQSFVSDDIGFFIAPRLNSAGRLEDAKIALDFLLAPTYDEASQYYDTLNVLNDKRKELQHQIVAQAYSQVNLQESVVVVSSKSWNEGVIGIVASRLVEKYKKPAFVFCQNGDFYKGSARAPQNSAHLYELIQSVSSSVMGFGGHASAAGLSVHKDKFEEFKVAINAHYTHTSTQVLDSAVVGALDLQSLDFEFLSIIEKFEPYGLDNKKPKFVLPNINMTDFRYLGKNKEHVKVPVKNSQGKIFDALCFHSGDLDFSSFKNVDAIVSIAKNQFRGSTSIQLFIDDIIKP